MRIIQRHQGWQVFGEAQDGTRAVELAKILKPDVILLDISMPHLSGLEAAREILQSIPRARILFLTVLDSDQVARQALQIGAKGYMLKSDISRDLVHAIEALQSNRTFFTARVSDLVLGGFLLEIRMPHPNDRGYCPHSEGVGHRSARCRRKKYPAHCRTSAHQR
jgi:DNA-binding NarL/FixJ family response regulator